MFENEFQWWRWTEPVLTRPDDIIPSYKEWSKVWTHECSGEAESLWRTAAPCLFPSLSLVFVSFWFSVRRERLMVKSWVNSTYLHMRAEEEEEEEKWFTDAGLLFLLCRHVKHRTELLRVRRSTSLIYRHEDVNTSGDDEDEDEAPPGLRNKFTSCRLFNTQIYKDR